MFKCKWCWMLKFTDKTKCNCNAKKFNEEKLIKKAAPKPIAKISKKKQERIKDNWSEWILFKKIYSKLAKKWLHKCMVCWVIVDEEDVNPSCFPHILPKWKYPEYRYFENNIWFVCWIEHHTKFDEAINNYKEINWLLELETQIKNWNSIDISNYIW